MENTNTCGTGIEIEAIPQLRLFHDTTAAGGSKDGNYYSLDLDNDIGDKYKQLFEVDRHLKEFVKNCVYIYESSLSEYYERLESQRAKPGKWADFTNKVIETGKCRTGGIEAAGIKAASLVGVQILQNIVSGVGAWNNRKELKKLIHQLYRFKGYPDEVRKELVKSGIDIFRSFESQFVQVTADKSWQRAMTKLAHDAVNRIMNYYKENTEEEFSAFTKGVILGKSKSYKYTSANAPHIVQGHTLQGKDSRSWNTAELFEKVGLVIIGSNGRDRSYYGKRDDNSGK